MRKIEYEIRKVTLLPSQNNRKRSREPKTQDDITIPDEFPFDMFEEEQAQENLKDNQIPMLNYISTPGRNYIAWGHQTFGTTPMGPGVGFQKITLSQALDTIPNFNVNPDMPLFF